MIDQKKRQIDNAQMAKYNCAQYGSMIQIKLMHIAVITHFMKSSSNCGHASKLPSIFVHLLKGLIIIGSS